MKFTACGGRANNGSQLDVFGWRYEQDEREREIVAGNFTLTAFRHIHTTFTARQSTMNSKHQQRASISLICIQKAATKLLL